MRLQPGGPFRLCLRQSDQVREHPQLLGCSHALRRIKKVRKVFGSLFRRAVFEALFLVKLLMPDSMSS